MIDTRETMEDRKHREEYVALLSRGITIAFIHNVISHLVNVYDETQLFRDPSILLCFLVY